MDRDPQDLRLGNLWDGRLDTQMFGLKLLDQEGIQLCSHRSLKEGQRPLVFVLGSGQLLPTGQGGVSSSWHIAIVVYTHWSDWKVASGPECDHFRVGKAGEECRRNQPSPL